MSDDFDYNNDFENYMQKQAQDILLETIKITKVLTTTTDVPT